MIAIDTNVLLRFVLADPDEPQTAVAERWMRRQAPTGVYVDDIVLCEVEWVLKSRYRWARLAIADLLDDLSDLEAITIGEPTSVRRALLSFRKGRGDFSDYLIRERAKRAGAAPLATFDRALRGEPGVQMLG